MANALLTQLTLPLAGSYQLFYGHPGTNGPVFTDPGSFLGNVEANTLRILDTHVSEPVYSDELGEDPAPPIDDILLANVMRVRFTLQEVDRDAVLRLLHPATRNNLNTALQPGNPVGGMLPGTLRTSTLGALKLRPLYRNGTLGQRLRFAGDTRSTTGRIIHFFQAGIEPGQEIEQSFSAGLSKIPVVMRLHPCRSSSNNDSSLVYYEYVDTIV